MIKKFLKEAVTLATGKQSEKIVDLLDVNKHVNEFLIAKKLDLTINQTRNILYRISDYGLVSSIRKKDKRKGWYTYFWKIEPIKALEFLKKDIVKRMDQFENQIKSRELKRFYFCGRCHIELAEENALLHEFTCSECGDILSLKDNTKVLREMKKNLDRLRKDLSFISEEIDKESEKIGKKKEKERKLIKRKTKKKDSKKTKKKEPESKSKKSEKKPLKKTKVKKKLKKKSPKKSAKKTGKRIKNKSISKKKTVKKKKR